MQRVVGSCGSRRSRACNEVKQILSDTLVTEVERGGERNIHKVSKRVNSYNGSGTVARTSRTDWRPTDNHTRTGSSKVSSIVCSISTYLERSLGLRDHLSASLRSWSTTVSWMVPRIRGWKLPEQATSYRFLHQ